MNHEGRVLVFDGDPVIGQALTLLLQTVGYDVSFISEESLGERNLMADAALILLAPGWSLARRGALLEALGRDPNTAHLPVLEIGTSVEGASEPQRYVPWPTRTEDLRRRIDELLINDHSPGVNSEA